MATPPTPTNEMPRRRGRTDGYGHGGAPGFFTRWFLSTNHKDIGTLYIIFAIIGGASSARCSRA
jgi:hypothetical protein